MDFPWEIQFSDPLGRTIREERPGFGGATLVTEHTYDAAGRLLASEQPSTAASLALSKTESTHSVGVPGFDFTKPCTTSFSFSLHASTADGKSLYAPQATEPAVFSHFLMICANGVVRLRLLPLTPVMYEIKRSDMMLSHRATDSR